MRISFFDQNRDHKRDKEPPMIVCLERKRCVRCREIKEEVVHEGKPREGERQGEDGGRLAGCGGDGGR